MTDENPDEGPLLELRGALDRLDHQLLELLVRRMDIVADIAARKREHRVRIRDLARERRVLDDRCARAEELGLPTESIESVWRQLMLMSRERQAALRAEVPADVESKTVAIVGGEGGMGGSLKTLFSDLGHEVLSADLRTKLRPADAAAAADVVVISVPIRDTRAVIEELGPLVRKDALLMDVTSIKTDPMEAMLASTEASVLGTHPMFGPGVNTYQGQRVVICPGRGEAWLDWARQMLTARGLVMRLGHHRDDTRRARLDDGDRSGLASLQDPGARTRVEPHRRAARRDASLHLPCLPSGDIRDRSALRAVVGPIRADRNAQPGL
jgi:chorismate mutase/prephenate dehydrogenase